MDYNDFPKEKWYCDYLLVQEILDGNIYVWDALYRTTYPIVSNYAKKIYNSWEIVSVQTDDVVSEAYKRCFIKLDSYMGKSRFSTWVCGFCRYIMLEHYHKERMFNKYAPDFYSDVQFYNLNINPEDAIIIKERDLCLWSAFNSLSLQHQLLLKCYVLYEMKPKQLKRLTKFPSSDRNKELEIAICILRKRFLALYHS